MPRPNLTEYFLTMARMVATRGTCRRRQVACVITDKENHVLATGYNGPPRNFDHCVDHACPGANDKPGDTDNCLAVHAEQSALLQCEVRHAHALYCTNLPCFACAKLIANTPISRVICDADYADHRGLDVLVQAGCVVIVGDITYGMEDVEP
jgi:dCMP deaminase